MIHNNILNKENNFSDILFFPIEDNPLPTVSVDSLIKESQEVAEQGNTICID